MEEQGRSYGIVGAGRSGRAAARLLLKKGADLFVSDAGIPDDEARAELEGMGVAYETGGHTDRLLECDTILLSPGVPPDLPILQKGIERGITLTNEIEVASRYCRGTMIGITGTNGKTTTTELLGHICRQSGRPTWVAGNVGLPFSSIVEEVVPDGLVVLELSSFQLEKVQSFHPKVGLLLNVTPDHMDRYRDIEEYGAAKLRLTMNLDETDWLVYNADDAWLNRIGSMEFRPELLPFSLTQKLEQGACLDGENVMISIGKGHEKIIDRNEIGIRGPHNLMNSMAAALAARSVGIGPEVIADGLRTFRSLPHRMEDVGELDGVRYVNDSKGTNTDALRFALESYDRPIVLIAGGRSKNNVYDALLPLVRQRVKGMVLIGEAAAEMEEAFGSMTRTVMGGTDFPAAINMAREMAEPGDVILLSPACSSFDMFRNFEDRGDRFRSIVQGMIAREQVSSQQGR